MTDSVVQARGVHKKFRKGESYGSLRDLLPALARGGLSGRGDGLREREFWALRDVSFEVARGEAFGIIGPNGAGKSTLLKLLNGVMQPTSGWLEVRGRQSALIEIGAGFHQDLTGRENVFLNGTILGMTRDEIRRKFDAIVDFSGLEDFIDTPVKRYSSGMYARLGFSVAVHVEPEVLVVDEVLSVGDYLFQRKSQERMKSLLSGGTTVIFVSHNLRAVVELCPRAMLIEHGTVVVEGRATDVVQSYIERGTRGSDDDTGKDVYISRVEVTGEGGEQLQFRSGQRVVIDVEVRARRRSDHLSVGISCTDEQQYMVFNTSSQRLGEPAFTLEPGESRVTRLELTLNLAGGIYYVGAWVHRYDAGITYDARWPAATLYVSSDDDVRGVAYLAPKVIR